MGQDRAMLYSLGAWGLVLGYRWPEVSRTIMPYVWATIPNPMEHTTESQTAGVGVDVSRDPRNNKRFQVSSRCRLWPC